MKIPSSLQHGNIIHLNDDARRPRPYHPPLFS